MVIHEIRPVNCKLFHNQFVDYHREEMEMRKVSLFLAFIIFVTVSLPGEAVVQPVIELVDLRVDGSIVTQHLNQTEDFTFVTRIIFNLHWAANDLKWSDFGTAAGGLTNGTSISYDNQTLNSPIQIIHEFAHLAFDVEIKSDDKNPQINHLSSRLSFFKFVPTGLDMAGNRNLTFTVNDNLTAVCSMFMVSIEGWKALDSAGNPNPPAATWSPINILNWWATNAIPVAAFGIFALVVIMAVWKIASSWR